jgi:hypothetical protein
LILVGKGALDIPAKNVLVCGSREMREGLMHWSIQLVYPSAAKCSLESSPLTAELDPRQPHYQIREGYFIDGGSHARCCDSSIGFF